MKSVPVIPAERRRILFAIALTVALLGVTLVVGSITHANAERWVVENLRYSSVDYRTPSRSRPHIHLRTAAGGIYLLPERLWKGRMEGPRLANWLRSDSMVTVHVVGRPGHWLYGYPVVVRLILPGRTLAVPPRGVTERLIRLLLGPALIIAGLWGAAVVRNWQGRNTTGR